MKKMTTFILVLTVTCTALIAGFLYAYFCSVNAGLGHLADAEYLAAMQSINKAVLNPVFFASFMGTLFLLPLSCWLQYKAGAAQSSLFLLIAALVYAIGAFGVTIFGNVPLNETLARFNLSSASVEALANQRAMFEMPWNKLRNIRTFASVISLVLAIIACIRSASV
jgi:uncharacterized membrane protein